MPCLVSFDFQTTYASYRMYGHLLNKYTLPHTISEVIRHYILTDGGDPSS
jgi:hypothetical protein